MRRGGPLHILVADRAAWQPLAGSGAWLVTAPAGDHPVGKGMSREAGMSGKTERNARIGRLYYKALTDAAGYPNGMAYWEEMSANDKYHYTVTGLQFIGSLIDAGIVSASEEVGVNGRWGEGDCDEMLKHF